MNKNNTLLTIALLMSFMINAQSYKYKLNLNKLEKDQLFVELECPKIMKDEITYYFPKTVPGTYSELNYGKYVSDFKAYNSKGELLKTIKSNDNSFLISNAKTIKIISYYIDDTWDEKVNKNEIIFEPAGTGFEKNNYFILNNGGVFGCFKETESLPISISILSNNTMKGYSSLKHSEGKQKTVYTAKSYHELIDSPIFYTTQKPEFIHLGDCKITIASFGLNDSTSYYIKKELEPLFEAIELFTGELPVKEYNIFIYTKDLKEIGEIINSEKLGFFSIIKYMKEAKKGLGFGALEHGTSSFYYLPDFGSSEGKLAEINYLGLISQIVAHEFLHIYTPLNLHSQQIGNFNFLNPKMSKHLWLYEGVTEYFSLLIKMQGNLETVENTLFKTMKNKIDIAKNYPDSIPFTVMSENVLENPYSDLYLQVYERGAVMAMLLDIEIMELTNGEKTLKTVVFELSKTYGSLVSFDEESFILEFVKLVDPKLQVFFDNYITGTKPLDIEAGFNKIGITFIKDLETRIPLYILSGSDNGIKTKLITKNNKRTIKKVLKNDFVGFIKGDKVDVDDAYNCYIDKKNNFVTEEEVITVKVIRDSKEISLEFPAKYKDGIRHNFISINDEKTEKQQKLFTIWEKGF